MWKFIVDVVHDFVSSLQPDVGRGFLHVSNVFLFVVHITGPFQYLIRRLIVRSLNVLKVRDQCDGLVQDCSNSIANTLELLHFCTKPSSIQFSTAAKLPAKFQDVM